MRCVAAWFAGLVACGTEPGASPATCDTEVEIVAPTVVRELVTIQKSVPFARCLQLDTTAATTSASLLITAANFGDPQFELAVRSPSGDELASGIDQLAYELPAAVVAHVVLEIRLVPPLVTAGSNLAFDFFVEP